MGMILFALMIGGLLGALIGVLVYRRFFPIPSLSNPHEKQRILDSARLLSLGALTPGIAHEVNNSLTALIGNISLMRRMIERGGPSEQMGKCVAIQQEAAQRIVSILSSMNRLAQSEIQSERPVNLHQVIQQAMEVLNWFYPKVGRRLEFDLQSETPWVDGNGARICDALIQLIAGSRALLRIQSEGCIARIATSDEGEQVVLQLTGHFSLESAEARNSGRVTGSELSVAVLRELADVMKADFTVSEDPADPQVKSIQLRFPRLPEEAAVTSGLRQEKQASRLIGGPAIGTQQGT